MTRSPYTVNRSGRQEFDKIARDEIRHLWAIDESSKPGPKPTYTAREIARAAIELADESGLAALSMREVARRLNASAMSLYGQVSSKAELVGIMVDEVADECAAPTSGMWKERANTVAWANWRCFEKHPWLLAVDQHRPVLGPGVLRKYELELATFDDLAMSDVDRDFTLGSLLALTRGCAKGSVDATAAAARTGQTDTEWWAARAPFLDELNLSGRFPLASRVGAAAGANANAPQSPEGLFHFALRIWVAGVEATIDPNRRSEMGALDVVPVAGNEAELF